MVTESLTAFRDLMHAKLCYQLFITPIHFPVEKEYRVFARQACKIFRDTRTDILHVDKPQHHVIHHFSSRRKHGAKKILITHGWMSRSAYMIRLIHALRQRFDVYALDFPAHGEAKGVRLTWNNAVLLLNQTLNQLGPFYAVIGHSFGGSMLLNTLNLAHQLPQWHLAHKPDRVVLIASPTRMRIPVSKLARKLKLSRQGFLYLRDLFQHDATTNLRNLDFHHFTNHSQTPVLCVHGNQDATILPSESSLFCEQYPHGVLAMLPGADHISVLLDERVEKTVNQFLF